MTAYEARAAELIDRIEQTLKELREHLAHPPVPPAPSRKEAVKAFADETFKARDA